MRDIVKYDLRSESSRGLELKTIFTNLREGWERTHFFASQNRKITIPDLPQTENILIRIRHEGPILGARFTFKCGNYNYDGGHEILELEIDQKPRDTRANGGVRTLTLQAPYHDPKAGKLIFPDAYYQRSLPVDQIQITIEPTLLKEGYVPFREIDPYPVRLLEMLMATCGNRFSVYDEHELRIREDAMNNSSMPYLIYQQANNSAEIKVVGRASAPIHY